MKKIARPGSIIAILLLFGSSGFSQGIDTTYLRSFETDQYTGTYKFKKNIYYDNSTRFREDVFTGASGMTMTLYKTNKSTTGDLHYKYFQQYRGIPIENSMFIVHCRDGKATGATGKLFPELNISTSPGISKEDAVKKALQYDGAKKYEWEIASSERHLKESSGNPEATYYPQPTLAITEDSKGNSRLVYKMTVTAREPFQSHEYLIDANTGELVGKLSLMDGCGLHKEKETTSQPGPVKESLQTPFLPPPPPTCTDCSDNIADVFYYGNDRSFKADDYGSCHYQSTRTCNGVEVTVLLYDDNAPPGAVVTNTTDDWGTNYRSATTLLYGIDRVLDYYDVVLNRNSFDGAGGDMECVVEHWTIPSGAMWHLPAFGDQGIYVHDVNPPATGLDNVAVSFDVIGHEFTHGVIRSEVTFISHPEAGYLNEAVADIFGTMFEHYAKPQVSLTPNYQIAEECYSTPNCMRNLADPNSKNHPDTYLGDYFHPIWTNGGGPPHINSNVISHWFYLLAEGGSGENDNDDDYCVEPIGREKATQIVYEALHNQMSSFSIFTGFRTAVIAATEALYGDDSYEEGQVVSAFFAVGIGTAYVNGPLIMDGHTITAAENIHWNDAIEYQNTTISNGHYDASSSVSISLLAHTSITTGTSASFYIAPDCAGGARMSAVPGGNYEVEEMGAIQENTLQADAPKKPGEEIAIFPNPTDGLINIRNNGKWNLQYEVCNMQGDVLLKDKVSGTSQVDITSLTRGIYLMRLINTGNSEVKQFKITKM